MARLSMWTASIASLGSADSVIVLSDPSGGNCARIWPDVGCNCYHLDLSAPDGSPVTVIAPPPDPRVIRDTPSKWGTPILFPWPGRIPGGKYRFRGTEYQLPDLDAMGNATHGFVIDRPWSIVNMDASDTCATAELQITYMHQMETLRGYPFPYRVTVEFRLRQGELRMIVEVTTMGPLVAPFALGLHPYFRTPLCAHGRREDCVLHVPATRQWNLDEIRKVVPGAGACLDNLFMPVDERGASGPLGDRMPDAVLTGLQRNEQRWTECTLFDPACNLEVAVHSSPGLSQTVLYTPTSKESLCIEPWTAPPNMFNLADAGVHDSGIILLPPGSSWTAEMRIELRART